MVDSFYKIVQCCELQGCFTEVAVVISVVDEFKRREDEANGYGVVSERRQRAR